MRRHPFAAHRLAFEPLENRDLPTGVVTAIFGGSTARQLTLTGDNQANLIAIDQVGGKGDFLGQVDLQVQGIGTKIEVNGKRYNSITFRDVTNLEAAMGRGNDSVVMNNIAVRGSIVIDMGTGNDVLKMNNVGQVGIVDGLNIFTHIQVELGAGNDVACLTAVSAQDNILLDAGDGRDSVALYRVATGRSPFTVPGGGTLSVQMGGGDFDSLMAVKCDSTNADLLDSGGSNDSLVRVRNNFEFEMISGFKYVV